MTTYESEIKIINKNIDAIYAKLSNLTNLENLKDKIPAEVGVKEIKCDKDSISFNVNPVGDVTLRIIDREEPKTIKFGADKSPISFNMWIQLVDKSTEITKLKITIKADIPIMLRPMIGNKFKDFLNKLADILAKIDY